MMFLHMNLRGLRDLRDFVMSRRRYVAVTLLLLVGTATRLGAQANDAPSLFIDGAVCANVAHQGHFDFQTTSTDLSRTSVGGSISAGTFLTPHVTLRIEGALPNRSSLTYSPPGSPLASILPPPTTSIRQEFSGWNIAVLAGYQTSRRDRVQLGYVGGLAFSRQRLETTSTSSSPGFPPILLPSTTIQTTTSIGYSRGAVVGLDADVSITSHVSVVPQIRAVAFENGINVRPGVAVRWSQ